MTSELVSRLAIPGLPDWSGLVVLLLLGLAAVSFLLMPFSVFGLKGRLEAIEVQLDEIQAELRALAMRGLDPVPRRRAAEESWDEADIPVARLVRDDRPVRSAPPVPPPASVPGAVPGARPRQEPRLAPRTPLGER